MRIAAKKTPQQIEIEGDKDELQGLADLIGRATWGKRDKRAATTFRGASGQQIRVTINRKEYR